MCGPKVCSMKITQDVRDYAATLNDKEQGLSAEAIAKAGMADMSKKFLDMGAKVYVEAEKVKEANKAL
jgi:phosphomethylpyrimidine synthase